MFFTSAFLLGSAFALDAACRDLAADAKLAIDRSGRTQDWFARVIGMNPAKLSVQLNGQAPFTAFARFGCQEIRRESDFWSEFCDLQLRRVDRTIVRLDVGVLLAKVDRLTDLLVRHKPMQRMGLTNIHDERKPA